MRRLLEKAVREYRIEEALEKYREGEATLRKAAKICDLTLWEFMEKIKEEDITFKYSTEDLEEDIRAVKDE